MKTASSTRIQHIATATIVYLLRAANCDHSREAVGSNPHRLLPPYIPYKRDEILIRWPLALVNSQSYKYAIRHSNPLKDPLTILLHVRCTNFFSSTRNAFCNTYNSTESAVVLEALKYIKRKLFPPSGIQTRCKNLYNPQSLQTHLFYLHIKVKRKIKYFLKILQVFSSFY